MRLAFLFILCTGFAAAQKAPPGWWHRSWTGRILFVAKAPAGPSLALELPTAGLARPDGLDLRVTTLDGREVPFRLLQAGPGDEARLCCDGQPFAGAERRGCVYLGNPSARPPDRLWQGEHGVILEVRELAVPRVDAEPQMHAAVNRSTRVLGRLFADRVFQGINPCGPERSCLAVFSGYLLVPKAGTYAFATNSVDASLLMIGGRTVASWLGWHGPEPGSSRAHMGEAALAAGTHAFFYLNANHHRGVSCALGLKAPDDKELALASPHAFVRWTVARPSALQALDGRELAWFDWELRSDLGLSERDVTCLSFRDLSGVPAGDRLGDLWDFGDGASSRAPEPEHVFLERGLFPVTHVIHRRDGRQVSLTQRVSVQPRGTPGWKVYEEVGAYAKILATYNPERLAPAALANAVFVLRAARAFDQALPFLEAMIARAADLDRPGLADEAFFLAEELRDRRHDYARAEKILQGLRRGSRDPAAAQRATALLAELRYEHFDDAGGAAALLAELPKAGPGPRSDLRRFALIKQADLLLERGDRAGAERLLAEAAALERGPGFAGADEASAGEHLVAYEEYAGRKEYAEAMRELRAWEWDAPLDKLTGQFRYLRADLYVLLGRPADAVREVERLEKADPGGPDVPAALILKAQCQVALGRQDEARRTLRRIVDEFPVAEARKEAEKRLEALR